MLLMLLPRIAFFIAATLCPWLGPLHAADLVVGGGSVVLPEGTYDYDNVVHTGGGFLYINGRTILNVSGQFQFTNGSIYGAGQGYYSGTGPDAGTDGGGGGHFGSGGASLGAGGTGSDDPADPQHAGSGGGNYGSGFGAAGGATLIVNAGSAVLGGALIFSGSQGSPLADCAGLGGGGGGAVVFNVQGALSGNGTIYVRGGNGGNATGSGPCAQQRGGGGGGGGLVRLCAGSNSFSGSIFINGGSGGTVSTCVSGDCASGGNGGNGQLIVACAPATATATMTRSPTPSPTPSPSVTLTPDLGLAQALDAPGLFWVNDAVQPWSLQGADTHDSVDAASVSLTPPTPLDSAFHTMVQGPGELSFWWKGANADSDDKLEFYVNAGVSASVFGTPGWVQVSRSLASGPQQLRWRQNRQSGNTAIGLVDEVVWSPYTPTPTATPSATTTATPTASPTATPSATTTATPTASPTATPSISPSPSSTATATASPSASPSLTATPSASPSVSPTPTQTPSISPSPSASATSTAGPTPAYLQSGLGHGAAGPVPARRGEWICLYHARAPLSSRWQVYNSGGEKVADLRFGAEARHCWHPHGVAPGLYFLSGTLQDGHGATKLSQKLVILP